MRPATRFRAATSSGSVAPAGTPPGSDIDLDVSTRCVGEQYFETAGIPVLAGRPILASDVYGSEGVVVINEAVADRFWPHESPIGKRLRVFDDKVIVGVVPSFKAVGLDSPPSPQVYSSYRQRGCFALGESVILVRAGRGSGLPAAVAGVFARLDKDVQVEARSMAQWRWEAIATQRFRTTVLLVFATTALLLALIGVAGLVAASVVQRYRELGVRVALGATARQAMHVVIREALVPAIAGLGVGVIGARLATRALSSFLFAVQPTDPATFGVAVASLAAAVVAASVLPARRVLRIDPVTALRHD